MYKKLTYLLLMLLVLGVGLNKAYAINGADISTLTTQENFGVEYYECGIKRNCLTILKNRGINLARIRLFVNPNTSETGTAMDLNYVTNLAQECKDAGMQVMLCIHYSDTWADPGQQTKPSGWPSGQELIDQVYNYTKDVVSQVNPDYVQIGNETNCGMLWPDGEVCDNGNWSFYADLVNAGVWGAEDGGCNNTIVHIAPTDPEYTVDWFFGELTSYTTEFSIIGLSYYPQWHGTISDLQNCVNDAKNYKSSVMICEVAEYYTGGNETEENQYQVVQDCQTVGAAGVVYWEPAWVWDSPVGYMALFKPIDDNWKKLEMTLALEQGFGGSPCGSGSDTDMYVNDIAMSYKKAGSNYSGIATVWIMDDTGANVDEAAVYGTWSGATSESQSGLTNSSGKVTFKSSKVQGGGTFTFTVTGVVKTGYVYNPDLNVETSDSITAP